MKQHVALGVLTGLMLATAIAVAGGDWSDAERKYETFKSGQESLKKLTPDEAKKLVSAICEAEEEERKSVSESIRDRVKDAVEQKYDDLEDMKDEALKSLEEVQRELAHGLLMPPTIAIRFRFPKLLVDDAVAATTVADVLARPCFARLERVAAKQRDKLAKRTKATTAVVGQYLCDHAFEGVVLENGGKGDLIASAEFPNGEHARTWPPSLVRYYCYVAVPFVEAELEQVVHAACDLARALDARAGAITIEPDFEHAQRWALESPRPKPRPGLTERRLQERRAHRRFEDDLATKVSGPDWGTFLGPGHLDRLDRKALTSAAARVIELTPTLLFMQATSDPMDELTEGFDEKLNALRTALTPVLMELSTVAAEP